jgi:hypothetical protein
LLALILTGATACNREPAPTAENVCKHQLEICGQEPEKQAECLVSLDKSINVYRELLKKEENKGVAKLAPDAEIYKCLLSVPVCQYFSSIEVREYCYFQTEDLRKSMRRKTGIRNWPVRPRKD